MQADEVKQASGRLQQSSPFLYLLQRNCHRKQIRLVHGEREYNVSLPASAHKAPAHVPLVLPDVSIPKQRCPYGQRRCSDLHRTFPFPSLPSYWGIVCWWEKQSKSQRSLMAYVLSQKSQQASCLHSCHCLSQAPSAGASGTQCWQLKGPQPGHYLRLTGVSKDAAEI